MTAAGDTLTLPGGASFAIRKSAAETGGERVELEITLPPDASGPPPHFHPHQEEQWHVLRGTLEVQVDGIWRTLREGESASIPAGHVHTLRNRTNEDARVLDVHIPALDFQDYREDLHQLTEMGKITSLRSLIYLATVLREHRTTQLTASRAQRIAESALAGLGRLLGMRVR